MKARNIIFGLLAVLALLYAMYEIYALRHNQTILFEGIPKLEEYASELAKKVAVLRSDYETDVKRIDGQLIRLSFDTIEGLDRGAGLIKHQVDVNERLYYPFDTPTGKILLKIQGFERAEDGFSLQCAIGNPSSINYKGFNVTVRWGGSEMPDKPNLFESPTEDLVEYFDDYKTWADSQASLTKEYDMMLEPGYWTEFEIEISPAQFSDLDKLFFEIQTSMISLDTRKSLQ